MKGFIFGSLLLIAGYVVLQPGSADKVASAGSLGNRTLARMLSPGVSAIPDHRYSAGRLGKSKQSIGAAAGSAAAAGAAAVGGAAAGSTAGRGLGGVG